MYHHECGLDVNRVDAEGIGTKEHGGHFGAIGGWGGRGASEPDRNMGYRRSRSREFLQRFFGTLI